MLLRINLLLTINLPTNISLFSLRTILWFFIGFPFLLASPISLHGKEIVADAFVNRLILDAEKLKLAYHPTWLRLLHFELNKKQGDTSESDVISPSFFISPIGHLDPHAELNATLNSFFEVGINRDLDSHSQCRFIARFNWLKSQLDFSKKDLTSVVCERFNQWLRVDKIESISLIFASGYLGNPASFFGHPLLKTNDNKYFKSAGLQDISFNFGAIVPKNENGLMYVINGLFGGYESVFSDTLFFRQNHVYVENELRDLWVYEMNLEREQQLIIVYHLWELMEAKFEYYFLKQNCAFKMAELLELALNDKVTSDLPWSVPINVFNRLLEMTNKGRPLIKEIRFIPSRQRRFHDKMNQLTKSERDIVSMVVNQDLSLKSESFQKLSEKSRAIILETFMDFYKFRLVKSNGEPRFAQKRLEALSLRSMLPASTPQDTTSIKKPSPPTKSTFPGLFRIGVVSNRELGGTIEIGIRTSYLDLIGNGDGQLENANLTTADGWIRFNEEKVFLHRLDLINLQNYNLSKTGLPGDGGIAWRIRLGWERVDLQIMGDSVFHLTGGIGKGFYLNKNHILYTMIDGFSRIDKTTSVSTGAIPSFGYLSEPTIGWKFLMEWGHELPFDRSEPDLNTYRFENRFGSSQNWDIRISYLKRQTDEFSSSINIFW